MGNGQRPFGSLDEKEHGWLQKRAEKYKDKREKPFARRVCWMLFLIHLVLTLGFGALEVRNGMAGVGYAPADALGGLLVLGLISGLPLALVSRWQLGRIRAGTVQEKPRMYHIWFWTPVVIVGLLLAGWVIGLVLR